MIDSQPETESRWSSIGGSILVAVAMLWIGAAMPRDRDIADRWDWKADGEAFGRTIYFAGQQA